jgi:tripartite-type tricarboxylate transporter receptor subunit TctC
MMLNTARLGCSVPLLAFWLVFAPVANAADPVAEFYSGKTVRLVVSSEPGGGFDLVARSFARYFNAHVPGKPGIVVMNMPGGGGLTMANWAYNIAPKDGTVIAMPLTTLPINQLILPDSVRYDAGKLNWIGNLEEATGVLFTWHSSPTKTIKDATTRETTLAGTGKNSIIYQLATLANTAMGTKFKVILGYTQGRVIAIERGEVEGSASTLENFTAMAPHWLSSNPPLINVLAVHSDKRVAKFPDVPTFMELTANPDHKQMLEFTRLQSATGRALFTTQETPPERVVALRRAFDKAVQDKDLVADLGRLKIELGASRGEDVQAAVSKLLATPPHIVKMTLEAFK